MDELIRQQLLQLKQSEQDPALVKLLDPVVAVGFGVAPLARAGRTLHVAAIRPQDDGLQQTLGRIIGLKVVAHPYYEPVVLDFLTRNYMKAGSLNFNTFEHSEFLDDPTCYARLASQKATVGAPPAMFLPPGHVVLLDVSLRSQLVNLDQPSGVPHVKAADPTLPFRVVRGGHATLYRAQPLPADCFMYLQASYFYGGLQYTHGIKGVEVKELPYDLHPTELQIAQVGRGGDLGLFVYDQVCKVWPGEQDTFECAYYYLSYGSRMRRSLSLRVNQLHIVPRKQLVYQAAPARWTSTDLARWLGFDWPE